MAHLWYNSITAGNTLPFYLEYILPTSYQYKQNLLEVGDSYYLDGNSTLESIPSELTGDNIVWIMTKDADKDNTSDTFLTLGINENVTVYIAYDPRATSLPDWLSNNFVSAGTVGATNPETSTYNLYSADFMSGDVVLGGNKAAGAVFPEGISAANYFVIIKR